MEELSHILNDANLDAGKVALILMVVRLVGEAFSALKNGGGLLGLGRAILYGQNVPKPIAEDYHKELQPGGDKGRD